MSTSRQRKDPMDGGQVSGRRRDGVVVPTVVAALMGGLGVLAVAITGAWGFTDALSTDTLSAAGPPPATSSAATSSAATASAPVVLPPTPTDGFAVRPSPVADGGPVDPVAPVEASTAPAPIEVTP